MPATAASANGTAVFFWLFALLALGGALAMITRKNAVAAVMCLVGTVIALAALFAMLHAHFLAAIQASAVDSFVVALICAATRPCWRRRPPHDGAQGRIGSVAGVADRHRRRVGISDCGSPRSTRRVRPSI